MTGRIGPNVSSVISFIVWSTSTTTVGSKKRPGPAPRLPPTSTFAPFSTASLMCSSIRFACGANVTAPTSTAPQADLMEERSEEHTSELQSRQYLVCRLLLEKKKQTRTNPPQP